MIEVQIEMPSLKKILKELDVPKDKSKLILRKAINDTVKETQKYMFQEADAEYTMESEDIKAALDQKKATTGNLFGAVYSRSNVKEMYADYNYDLMSGGGFAANIVRGKHEPVQSADGSRKAFYVTYKNSNKFAGARDHTTIAIRKGKKKLPIHTILAPSVPKQMGFYSKASAKSKAREEKTTDYVHDRLAANIQTSITRFLGGSVTT